MSFSESYHQVIEEMKAKRKQQEEELGLFSNKVKFGQCKDELDSFFASGKFKPSEIKPKTYLEMIYSWFR